MTYLEQSCWFKLNYYSVYIYETEPTEFIHFETRCEPEVEELSEPVPIYLFI